MNPRRAPLRRLGLAAGALGAAAALSLVAFGADATPGHMHCVAHTGTKPPHSHWATFHTDLAPWRGHRCVPAADVSAADLYAMARETATNTGDPHPTDVQAVLTTHRKALAVMEPGAPYSGFGPADPQAFVITMSGHFIDYLAGLGSFHPSGTVITIVIDPATGAEMDFGLNNRRPDLAAAGRVMQLG